jgi:hypothetical protein
MMGCVAQRILYHTPPLTSNQAAACFDSYTTQSERIVLQWFLENMPFGKRCDLMQTYDEEMRKIRNESVELF